MTKPTLEYWQAKADLCFNLFLEQCRDKDKQGEALANYNRYKIAKHNAQVMREEENGLYQNI